MENNNNINQIKNPIFIKEDIFSDYLIISQSFENSPLNQDFAKPDNEIFDKFFNNDENSLKSLNSLNDLNKSFFQEPKLEQPQLDNSINILNGAKEKIFLEEKRKKENNNTKKNELNSIVNKDITPEERKQKKLIMNRESAKKSRLKKKNYIENLEKQYIIMKEEFIKIKEEQKSKLNNNKQLNPNDTQYIIKNSNINNNMGEIKNNILEIYNIDNIDNVSNINGNKQKKLMTYILINQIDIMTPIKIKAFQNKYLKMQTLDLDDTIEAIKNKIDTNLNIITELYGIESGNNNCLNFNFINNKKSMAFQLYEFYNNIKLLINKFEHIFNKIDN